MATYPRLRYGDSGAQFFIDIQDCLNLFEIKRDRNVVFNRSLGNIVNTSLFNKTLELRLEKDIAEAGDHIVIEHLYEWLCEGNICHFWFDRDQVMYASFSNSLNDSNGLTCLLNGAVAGSGLVSDEDYFTTLRAEAEEPYFEAGTNWLVNGGFENGSVNFKFKWQGDAGSDRMILELDANDGALATDNLLQIIFESGGATGRVRFFDDSAVPVAIIDDTFDLSSWTLGVFHHLLLEWDVRIDNTMRLYIDGTLVKIFTYTAFTQPAFNDGARLRIGWSKDSGTYNHSNGKFNDIEVRTNILTTDERLDRTANLKLMGYRRNYFNGLVLSKNSYDPIRRRGSARWTWILDLLFPIDPSNEHLSTLHDDTLQGLSDSEIANSVVLPPPSADQGVDFENVGVSIVV